MASERHLHILVQSKTFQQSRSVLVQLNQMHLLPEPEQEQVGQIRSRASAKNIKHRRYIGLGHTAIAVQEQD